MSIATIRSSAERLASAFHRSIYGLMMVLVVTIAAATASAEDKIIAVSFPNSSSIGAVITSLDQAKAKAGNAASRSSWTTRIPTSTSRSTR